MQMYSEDSVKTITVPGTWLPGFTSMLRIHVQVEESAALSLRGGEMQRQSARIMPNQPT